MHTAQIINTYMRICDYLGEVDVVACGTSAAVGARLRFDGDGLRGANRFAKLYIDTKSRFRISVQEY